MDLPYEITYSLLAISGAIISFIVVKLTVKYAYYFFMLTRPE
jgi:hypothetical protein